MGVECKVAGVECKVYGVGYRAWVLELWVEGLGFARQFPRVIKSMTVTIYYRYYCC